jgi:hypothetical protein
MQQIFAKVAAEPAVRQGLFGDPQKLVASGDGTCVLSGGSAWGSKQCSCREKGIYNCDCPRIFSDPYARYGWDSYHNCYFYGYSAYILAVYNPDLKCDLPIYLRVVQANRHDSVSSIVALSEFRSLYPDFTIDTFCGDCAHDATGIYGLLEHWKIKAVIPLKSNSKADHKEGADFTISKEGVPICLAGLPMVNWGFNPERRRVKFRCPLACGKIDHCDHEAACQSVSDYGRTIYVTQNQDLRFATRIRRGSAQWKTILRSRTASERFNKRLLNDYGLEKHKARGKKRISWWTLVHSTNILLDAARKLNRPSFISLLTEACAA